MARSARPLRLPAPFLKHVRLDPTLIPQPAGYPFTLPMFAGGQFELTFERPITILVGENGSGKSTLLEGLAALAGFDQAGGGKGYRPVDHSQSIEATGEPLGAAFRASWLPRLTHGWFFRAESFFSVARYLDQAAREWGKPPPDFLSHSHGEGFLRFFAERCATQGLFLLDEPESALSPRRQIDLLKILRHLDLTELGQVVMATHSPLLMACPNATLLRCTPYGLEPTTLEQTDHFRMLREFFADPTSWLDTWLE